jgi:hypothetical protein
MKSFASLLSLTLLISLALPSLASTLDISNVKRKHGGGDGGGDGGDDGGNGGGNGGNASSGIPTKANNKNPVCLPWYDIRDAIMGGIFHGRCDDLSRAAVRLAFHDAGEF